MSATGVFLPDNTIRHYSDFSWDMLDELKNTLLARSLEEHGGIQHDTSIIPAFIEKLNSEALFSITIETRHRKVPDRECIHFNSFTRFERYDAFTVDMRLATNNLLGPIVMLFGTDEYKQSFGKLFELMVDFTVRPRKDTRLKTATFMLNEFFNGLWTITNIFQQLQFFDHFKTDTTPFTMTILWNILLHNVNRVMNFCSVGKKQDSNFDDCIDVTQSRCNTIRMC